MAQGKCSCLAESSGILLSAVLPHASKKGPASGPHRRLTRKGEGERVYSLGAVFFFYPRMETVSRDSCLTVGQEEGHAASWDKLAFECEERRRYKEY